MAVTPKIFFKYTPIKPYFLILFAFCSQNPKDKPSIDGVVNTTKNTISSGDIKPQGTANNTEGVSNSVINTEVLKNTDTIKVDSVNNTKPEKEDLSKYCTIEAITEHLNKFPEFNIEESDKAFGFKPNQTPAQYRATVRRLVIQENWASFLKFLESPMEWIYSSYGYRCIKSGLSVDFYLKKITSKTIKELFLDFGLNFSEKFFLGSVLKSFVSRLMTYVPTYSNLKNQSNFKIFLIGQVLLVLSVLILLTFFI